MTSMLQTHSRYSSVAIGFHWSIALLISVNIVLGLGHESFGEANVGAIMGVHKSIGFTVLVLSLMRLGWRLGHPVPPLPALMPVWQKGVAHATHFFLYVAMIGLPMSGWLMSSAAPKRYPMNFFGLFDIPYLPVAQVKAMAGLWHETHEILGFVTIAIVVLHVAAALKHHLIDKDDVLVRIMRSKG